VKHNISTLPNWAQNKITDLQAELQRTREDRDKLASMMQWSKEGMGWFMLGPMESVGEGTTILFTLHRNHAQPVCSLGPKDKLFVGRYNETR
jgi:hypothetical protein